MQISDVALVCADNVRARCYMQAFTARKLLPSFCLILPAAESGNPDPRRRRLSPAEVPWGRFDPERSCVRKRVSLASLRRLMTSTRRRRYGTLPNLHSRSVCMRDLAALFYGPIF